MLKRQFTIQLLELSNWQRQWASVWREKLFVNWSVCLRKIFCHCHPFKDNFFSKLSHLSIPSSAFFVHARLELHYRFYHHFLHPLQFLGSWDPKNFCFQSLSCWNSSTPPDTMVLPSHPRILEQRLFYATNQVLLSYTIRIVEQLPLVLWTLPKKEQVV